MRRHLPPNRQHPQRPEPTPPAEHPTGPTPIAVYLKHVKVIRDAMRPLEVSHLKDVIDGGSDWAEERFRLWLLRMEPRVRKILRADRVLVGKVRAAYVGYTTAPIDAAINRLALARDTYFKGIGFVYSYKITGSGAAAHLSDGRAELDAAIENLEQYAHFPPSPAPGVRVPNEHELLLSPVEISWSEPSEGSETPDPVPLAEQLSQVHEQTREFREFMGKLPPDEQHSMLEALINPDFEPPVDDVPAELTITERCCLRALSQLQGSAGEHWPNSDQIATRALGPLKRGSVARPLARLVKLGFIDRKTGRGGGYRLTSKGVDFLA